MSIMAIIRRAFPDPVELFPESNVGLTSMVNNP